MKVLNLIRKYTNPIKYLEKKGAKIGKHVVIEPPVGVTEGFLLEIGNNCNLSSNIQFFTHDGSNIILEHLGQTKPGYRKYGKISIGNNVFIGANTTFLPGITIGSNVVIGTGSIVTKSFPSDVVIAGSPAKIICTIDEFKKKKFRTIHPF